MRRQKEYYFVQWLYFLETIAIFIEFRMGIIDSYPLFSGKKRKYGTFYLQSLHLKPLCSLLDETNLFQTKMFHIFASLNEYPYEYSICFRKNRQVGERHMMLDVFTNVFMPFYKFGDILFLAKIDTSSWISFITDRFRQTEKFLSDKQAELFHLVSLR